MEYTLFTKLAAEFVGTAVLMVFGNGAVANTELKNTKGYHAGWLNIAMGYGFGVMFPVLMFGGVSGAHINPAMTLAQAVNGMFPWNEVLPYIIAQLLGAVAGQLIDTDFTYFNNIIGYETVSTVNQFKSRLALSDSTLTHDQNTFAVYVNQNTMNRNTWSKFLAQPAYRVRNKI